MSPESAGGSAAGALGGTMLNAARRELELSALAAGEVVDVVVVGGGVTGAGVALDAASRGLSVALVEREDLAAGTSRWSSKLAHGGLRYISKGQLGVAWESAVERNALARTIAPHLVRPMPFMLPMLDRYPPGARAVSWSLLALADAMRAATRTPSMMPRGRWADAAETRSNVPAIVAGVSGSYVHVDGALEDDARLVVAIARTAAGFGARIVTHATATDIARDGVHVRDELTGDDLQLRARVVVVAAGVWSGRLLPDVPMRPSRGSHLVLRAEALGRPRAAVNVMLPGSVSRFVFAVPRPDGTVLAGLTDDEVDAVDDVPSVPQDDERWLLEMLSSGLSVQLGTDDVIGRFAGLRPLLADPGGSAGGTADVSRKHALLEREGVLLIVGGKLTTYRRMAQDTVDAVCRRLGRGGACRTRALPLVGAEGSSAVQRFPERLVRRYGGEAALVAEAGEDSGWQPIAAGAPALRCELGWALRAEGAITAADVLERRLRLDLVDTWADAARPVIEGAVAATQPASM